MNFDPAWVSAGIAFLVLVLAVWGRIGTARQRDLDALARKVNELMVCKEQLAEMRAVLIAHGLLSAYSSGGKE